VSFFIKDVNLSCNLSEPVSISLSFFQKGSFFPLSCPLQKSFLAVHQGKQRRRVSSLDKQKTRPEWPVGGGPRVHFTTSKFPVITLHFPLREEIPFRKRRTFLEPRRHDPFLWRRVFQAPSPFRRLSFNRSVTPRLSFRRGEFTSPILDD